MGIPQNSATPCLPSQITSNQNNYNPDVASFYCLTSDASRNITGLSIAQVDGQECELWNGGSFNIVIQNQNANSTASNRFLTDTAGDVTITPNARVVCRYDGGDHCD